MQPPEQPDTEIMAEATDLPTVPDTSIDAANASSAQITPPAVSESCGSEPKSNVTSPKSVRAPSTARSPTPDNEQQILLKLCHPYFKDSAANIASVCELLYKLDSMYYMPVENAELDTALVSKLLIAMNHIVQTVSRATGGVMYMYYMRDDGQQGTEVWDACTERVQSLLTSHRGELVRCIIGDYVHRSLGPTFTCRSENAFPATFGSPAESCRPRLPPTHPLPEQERIVILRYFTQLAAWQGLPAIQWDEVERDVASSQYRLVDKSRVPPVLLRFADPSKLSDQEIRSLGRYLRSCQDRLDNLDASAIHTAFQWREPGSDGSFRTEMHADSRLTYDEAETFYMMAIRRHSFAANHYTGPADHEKIFNPQARALVGQYGKSLPVLNGILDLIKKQRLSGAPERTARDTDPKLLTRQTDAPHNVLDSLSDKSLPDDFTDPGSDMHEAWLVSALWRHVHKGNAVDPTTQRPWGGFGGVLRYFLASFRAYQVVMTHIDQTANLPPSHSRFGQQELDRLISIFKELHDLLKADAHVMNEAKPSFLPSGTVLTPWPARRVSYSNIMGVHQDLDWSEPFTAVRLATTGGTEEVKAAISASVTSGKLVSYDIDTPNLRELLGEDSAPVHDVLMQDAAQSTLPVQTETLLNPFSKAGPASVRPGAEERAAEIRKSSTARPRMKPLLAVSEEYQRRRSHSLPPSETDAPTNALELTMDDPKSPRESPGLFAFGEMNKTSTPHARGRSLVKDKANDVIASASSSGPPHPLRDAQARPSDVSTSQSRLGEAARLLARNSEMARSTARSVSPGSAITSGAPRAGSVIQQRTGPARKQSAKRTRGDGDSETKQSSDAQRKKSRSGSRQ